MFKALLLTFCASIILPSFAFAQATTKSDLPIYTLILLGNFDGGSKKAESISMNISAENGKFTVGKLALINTDEKAVSLDGEAGEKIDDLTIEFQTKHFKGVILRLFPDSEQEGDLTIESKDESWTYQMSDLRTLEDERKIGDLTLKVIPLQKGRFDDNTATELNFAPKLEVITILLGVEKWMSGRDVEPVVLENWRKVFFTGLARDYTTGESHWFRRKFARNKKAVNAGLFSERQLVNSINRLVIWNR